MRIGIIEDDNLLRKALDTSLKNQGYTTILAGSRKEAIKNIDRSVDLLIVDIGLPDGDGINLYQELQKNGRIPAIFLTAKDDEKDMLKAFDIGADDYVTKPFLPLELVARVKAQLRRYERYGARTDQPAENMSFDGNIIENTTANGSYDAADGTYASNHAGTESDDTIICRGILLKKCAHECYLDGDEISLTPTEFTILQALCEAKGRVLSAEELFHIIWKDEYYSKSNNTITVHIRHLREKLKDTGERPKYIKTVWGVGYKIEG